MLYYVFPYVYILILGGFIFFNKKINNVRPRTLLFLVFPALLVVILRGNVGTDTIQYYNWFREIKTTGNSIEGIEPGFIIIEKMLSLLGQSIRFDMAIISTTITFLLCKTFSGPKGKMILFVLVLFPVFYVDMTMNGIRYGLSFAIACIAIDKLFEKHYFLFAIYAFASVSIHYSALIIIGVFLLDLIKTKYIILLMFISALIFIVSGNLLNFFFEHIAGKEDAYKTLYAPSAYSGLAPLITFIFSYSFFLFYAKGKHYSKGIHLLLVLEIISYIIARYSYAGLRFQSEILFILLMYLKQNSDIISAKSGSFVKRLYFVSIFAFLIFLKNITTKIEGDMSPYLPYKFYWKETNG